MDWSVRLIHCEACSELLFCSSSSSNQCLRSACHWRLPWGHQNPFMWTISPCSKSCPLMMVSEQWHALCAVSRMSLFPSVCYACFLTTNRKSNVPPESSLHQLVPSDCLQTLSLQDSSWLPFFSPASWKAASLPPSKPPVQINYSRWVEATSFYQLIRNILVALKLSSVYNLIETCTKIYSINSVFRAALSNRNGAQPQVPAMCHLKFSSHIKEKETHENNFSNFFNLTKYMQNNLSNNQNEINY